jgi:hypothetical protein
MAASRIDGIRLKIERAKKHISDLDVRIAKFCESKPYTIAAKPHAVPQIHHTTLYVKSVQAVPPDFSLIVGDAVHNLRSSLDHLAWQLVEVGGGKPGRDTYFPICNSGEKYASAMGKREMKSITVDAKEAIRVVQSYVSGDRTLLHIHGLDIVDKHRLVLTTIASSKGWGVEAPIGTLWFDNRLAPLMAGQEITNLPTSTFERQRYEHFKLAVDIAFGEIQIVEGKPVLETLQHMADFVDGLVGQFKPFLI